MTIHDLAPYIFAFGSLAFTAWRERAHIRERQDLLNRLMARDYREYAISTTGKPTEPARSLSDEEAADLAEQKAKANSKIPDGVRT